MCTDPSLMEMAKPILGLPQESRGSDGDEAAPLAVVL